MKCPACFNELSPLQVGTVTVDVCQDSCGGVWFDAFELQRVDEQQELAGEPMLEIRRDTSLVVDATRKRSCPRCQNMKLQRHFFSAKRKIEVDECPNCGGYWLDAGELAAIRAEKAQTSKAAAARTGLSSEDIRYLYRMHTHRGPET